MYLVLLSFFFLLQVKVVSSFLVTTPFLEIPRVVAPSLQSLLFQDSGKNGNHRGTTFSSYHVDDAPFRLALDVQCGIGDSTLELRKRLSLEEGGEDWCVLGIDEDPVKTALARRKHPSLTFLTGDVSGLPSATYDKIQVHTGRMLHIPDKGKFTRELTRVLKPGGTLDMFDFSLSHSFLQEIIDVPEKVRRHYFQGWDTYDPCWHQSLLAQWLLLDTVVVDEDIIHSLFVKYRRE